MRLPTVRIETPLDHDALSALYGDRDSFTWAPDGEPRLTVLAFGNEDGPHWHYVALGARDLCGHELSFRLAAASVDDAAAAPRWPVELLQRLARQSTGADRPLGDGEYVCFERALDPDGAVRCVAVVADPQLPEALQAVGLHEDELPLVSEDSWRGFLEALRTRAPLLVTRPRRAPVRL